jgi:hypothetical protein
VDDARVGKIFEDAREVRSVRRRLVAEADAPVLRGLLAHEVRVGFADAIGPQIVGQPLEHAGRVEAQPSERRRLEVVAKELGARRPSRVDPFPHVE